MKLEYVNPFITHTKRVFSTMLGIEISRGEIFVKRDPQPHHEVSGIIGLSGKAVGTLVLSLHRNVALNATEAMLEERPSEINADVVEAIGELTNIIAGGAKAELEQFSLSVSLPNVVTGNAHSIEFPSKATPISIPFDSEWGSVTIEVGLVEQPAEVPAAT